MHQLCNCIYVTYTVHSVYFFPLVSHLASVFIMVKSKSSWSQVVKNSRPTNLSISSRNLRPQDLGAVIFGCTNDTIAECHSRQLFGTFFISHNQNLPMLCVCKTEITIIPCPPKRQRIAACAVIRQLRNQLCHLSGLPRAHISYVQNIKEGLPLFLFNYDDRRLYGIYEAAGNGKFCPESKAWSHDGKGKTSYPAQVQPLISVSLDVFFFLTSMK